MAWPQIRRVTRTLGLGCLAAAASGACMPFATALRAPYVAQANAAVPGEASNLSLTPAVVFQNGTGTTNYHAPTFADLPRNIEVRDVQGRACESGLQVPWGALTEPAGAALDWMFASVGWGNSGYQRALREAAGQVAPDALLYDVRADLQTISVLGIWRQQCLIVTASAVTRMPDGPEMLLPATNTRPSVVPPVAPPLTAPSPAAGTGATSAPAADVATPKAPAPAGQAPTLEGRKKAEDGAKAAPTAAEPNRTPAPSGTKANDPAQKAP